MRDRACQNEALLETKLADALQELSAKAELVRQLQQDIDKLTQSLQQSDMHSQQQSATIGQLTEAI